MRVYLLSITAFMACAAPAVAQVSLQAGIEAGVSRVQTDLRDGNGFPVGRDRKDVERISFRAGVPVELRLSPSFKFNTGLFLAQKGVTGNPPQRINLVGLPAYFVAYSSLELPLVFCFNRSTEDHGDFFVGAGPYLGYVVWGKQKTRNGSGGNPDTENVDWGKNMKRMDAGIHLQTGYEFRSGLFIRLMSQRSLIDQGIKQEGMHPLFVNNKGFAKVQSKIYACLSVGYLLRYNRQ